MVGDVEELIVSKTVLATGGEVRRYIIEVAEEAGEGDVAGVVEVGIAEDEYAVLDG